MYKTFTLALLLCSFFSFAQSSLPKNNDGKFEYTEVVQADSLTASQLFSNAKLFITNSFVSGKDVTQLTDDNNKTIVAKGLIPVSVKISIGAPMKADVRTTLTIQCKDNRYKYSFTGFQFVYNYGPDASYASFEDHVGVRMSKKQWEQVEEQTDANVKALINKLKTDMAGKSARNDW